MLKILKNIDRKHYFVLGLILFSTLVVSLQRLEYMMALIFCVTSTAFAGFFSYASQRFFHNMVVGILANAITRMILAAIIILPFLKTENLNTTLLIISFSIAFLLSKYTEMLIMRRFINLNSTKIQENRVC